MAQKGTDIKKLAGIRKKIESMEKKMDVMKISMIRKKIETLEKEMAAIKKAVSSKPAKPKTTCSR